MIPITCWLENGLCFAWTLLPMASTSAWAVSLQKVSLLYQTLVDTSCASPPSPFYPGCVRHYCKAVVAQARVTLPQTNLCPFFLHTSPNTGLSLKLLKYGCNCHCTPPATHPCNTNMCASNPGCTICIFRLEIPLNFSKAKTFVETTFLLQVHATDHKIRGWLWRGQWKCSWWQQWWWELKRAGGSTFQAWSPCRLQWPPPTHCSASQLILLQTQIRTQMQTQVQTQTQTHIQTQIQTQIQIQM